MKKLLAILMAACLTLMCAAFAETSAGDDVRAEAAALPDPEVLAEGEAAAGDEAVGTVRLWFEEGFGLSVPENWVSYPVTDADREAGIRCALGDGAGYLYIRTRPTRIADAAALSELIEADGRLEKSGDLSLGGTPFIAFIDRANDAGGCATVWGDALLQFLFTPQSDSAFMMAVTELMETFTTP